ncbi:MAG TPA: hypothetical protein P5277_02315 [Candidatus Paceibacterota bacterium]|nr:hypothetical protein [Candidatus Paceibacterota bacterium]
MKKNLKIVYRIFLNLLIICLILLITFLNIYPKYILGGDNRASFLYPDSYLIKNSFLWIETNGVGSFFVGVQDTPLYFLQKFFSLFLDYRVIHYFQYALFNVLIFYSVMFFLKCFSDRYFKNRCLSFIYFIIPLFYLFNFNFLHANFFGLLIHVIPFFLIPFELSIFLKFLNSKNKIWLLGIFPIIFLGNNIAHFFVFFIILFSLTIFDLIVFKKNSPIKKYFLFYAISFLLIIFILIPNIALYFDSYNQLVSNKYITKTTVDAELSLQKQHLNLFLVSKNMINHGIFTKKGYYPINYNNVLLLLPFLLFVSGLFLIKNYRKFYSFFFLSYLICIFILKGSANPLGSIFSYFILKIPGAVMFRSIHFKFNYVFLIVQCILLLILFYDLYTTKVNNKIKLISYYSFLLIFIVLTIAPYFGFLSQLYSNSDILSDLPIEYVNEIKNFHNFADSNNFKRGFILPDTKKQWTSQTAFGFWGYSFFIQSSYDIGFFDQGTATSNAINEKIYEKLSNLTENSEDINSFFNKYSINFLIIQKDFNYNFSQYLRVNDQTSKVDSLLNFLITENLIIKVQSNDYFDVYKINIKDVSLINSKFIHFQKINPTKYSLYIKDLNENQDLSFLESYHKDWKLYIKKNPTNNWCEPIEFYENTNTTECKHTQKFFEGEELVYLFKKPVFDGSHEMVFDYANGWTIDPQYIKDNFSKEYYTENPDGSINVELVLYFKPQSYFYLGLIISITTFILCIAYLIYDFVKRHKKRHSEF